MFPYSCYVHKTHLLSRLKLLEAALAIYRKEAQFNAEAVVFYKGVMGRIVGKCKTRKTQS
jgi:hypothetical protein